MTTQLTEEQIESIGTNIRNRGIRYIDLELELIDHIICAVEKEMANGLTFYNAYKKVLATFGPFGMEKMQKQAENKLNKKLNKEIVKISLATFKEYLTLPKITLTLLIFMVIFLMLTHIKFTLPNFDLSLFRNWIFIYLFVAPLVIRIIFAKYYIRDNARFFSFKKMNPLIKNSYLIHKLKQNICFYVMFLFAIHYFMNMFTITPFASSLIITSTIILIIAGRRVINRTKEEIIFQHQLA